MSKIEFISHEAFPEDEYVKELVYLCLESKYRVAYVRKKTKTGGLFWSPANVGITKNGRREYFATFMLDSQFMEQDIRKFLEDRSWEVQGPKAGYAAKPMMSEVPEQDGLPF